MGIPKFSGVGIVDMQNSIASRTFSRNAYGTYTKTKQGAPAGGIYLAAWQTVVAGLRFDWINIMSDADRKSWYKLYIPRRNNMAEKYFLNGFASYLSCNMNRALFSLAPIYTAPDIYAPPRQSPFGSFSALDITHVEYTLTNAAPFPTAVFMSRCISPGRMTFTQIFAFIESVPSGISSTDLIAQYTSRLGAPVPGQKIVCKMIAVNTALGFRSAAQYFSGIVS